MSTNRVVQVSPESLFFGQQHAFSHDYFRKYCGETWNRVPIKKTPHYKFLEGDTDAYKEYLKYSWRYFYGSSIPQSKIDAKIQTFKQLFEDISKTRTIREPIPCFKGHNTNQLFISDGNHRCAIALFLGIQRVPAIVTPSAEHLKKMIALKSATYGTNKGTSPYQTIYYKGQVIVKGRRSDVSTRNNIVCRHVDLTGKSILDLGGNYGMSSHLALDSGAKEVCVVESNKDILTVAVRLAVFFGRSNASFVCHDLSKPCPAEVPVCDIGFCFSITLHVGKLDCLVKTIREKVRSVLFYESHENHVIEPVISSLFKTVKVIGKLSTRTLYMCTK